MDTTLRPVLQRVPVAEDVSLSVREWDGDGPPFLLVHGLASNARTWDGVATNLNAAGYRVVAVDQRGHGLSDKPDYGYSFEQVTADLMALIQALGLELPVIAGQSWGGNVVLEFAARYPEVAAGIVLVDGGFIELSSSEDGSWETISELLKPPVLLGTPYEMMLERMRGFHPDWTEEGIEGSLANFEVLDDGTIRPWLSLDRHMLILRALWEQRPSEIYPRVQTPVLLAVVEGPSHRAHDRKHDEVDMAEHSLAKVQVRWFEETAHDIHVHRPKELADWVLESLKDGFFSA